MTAPFVNIHTHKASGTGIELVNYNIIDSAPAGEFSSAGLHPWNIGKCNHLQAIETLHEWCNAGSISAIGEIGLDHCTEADARTQANIFTQQLQIAQINGLPAIIHCVKAYSDILRILNSEKPTIPIIFHGFTGNCTTMRQLERHNAFFSFGKRLLTSKDAQSSLANANSNRIFFETDNDDIPIGNIYNFAASIMNVDIDKLRQITFSNLIKIFGEKWTTVG